MEGRTAKDQRKKSIFRSIFIPLFLIMLLQAAIFYFAAVYGGIEESLSQNAADILSGRLINRKNELETRFLNKSFNLDACVESIQSRYAAYEHVRGPMPLAGSSTRQIQFLLDCSDELIRTLRKNEANGVFLILNDDPARQTFPDGGQEQKYGLCIRDIDQNSNYTGREDLLLERSPSSIVDTLNCSLDSWWEAFYTFHSVEDGDYYYLPLEAAWENPRAGSMDMAYLSGVHQISDFDQSVVSYSVPLLSKDGYPYAVVGVELTTKQLSSLLPVDTLSGSNDSSYILALKDENAETYTPLVGTGALYYRCFGAGDVISCEDSASVGGFTLTGRDGTALFGDKAQVDIYNNNNPFETRELTLISLAESDVLFAHIGRIKLTLFAVSLFGLALGLAGILLVSRRFASPITALAGRVRDMTPQAGFQLDRLGITEIDQLVDAIEELNRNVSKSSARSEFFSRMSHDMRTPMNAIISFSSPELLSGIPESAKDDYLEKIHASGDYLLGLINEVLDMTKIESNKAELHLIPIQAVHLLDTVLPIIEKLAQKKGVAFISELAVSADVFVMADTQYIDQIIMNLLSNAVKFTPAGGQVQLSMRLENDEAQVDRVRCQIVVSDTGVGMSEHFLKNLYVPFEQENPTREGTGLGLSIVKKLVELMDGAIDCVSKKNAGTVFTVELPLLKADGAAVSRELIKYLPGQMDLAPLWGKRVLICEDNALNTQIVSHLLSKAGIQSVIAENGRKGVEAFAASAVGEFAAILMDVQMPVMNGLEATKRIRAMERPDAASIPILAMTANVFSEDVQASQDAGMNEHLAKPIEINTFFAALLRYIE